MREREGEHEQKRVRRDEATSRQSRFLENLLHMDYFFIVKSGKIGGGEGDREKNMRSFRGER